jgi:hypothetical protein
MYKDPFGVLFFHNTVVKAGMPLYSYGSSVHYLVFKNNIFAGTQAGFAFEFTGPMDNCFFDYNGYEGKYVEFCKWGGTVYKTVQELQEGAEIELHAVELVQGGTFKAGIIAPEDIKKKYEIRSNDLRLGESSKAVDKACRLPNINDGFEGWAPDLGAYELGKELPQYGPRTGEE